MLNLFLLLLSIFCVIFYVFIMPFLLKNKKIKIPDNQFQSFVNNDIGYAWSRSIDRRKNYKKSIDEKLKINKKH